MTTNAYRVRPRPLLLTPEAWAVAEELAETTGVTSTAVIEIMLLDVRSQIDLPEPESVSAGANVIPISRGRRGRQRVRLHG